MIIGEIRRHLRDNNTIRVSRSVRDLAHKALSAKEQFIKQHQREPKISELSLMLDVPKEDITNALEAIQDPVSLFEPVYNDGGDTLYIMDQVKDTKNTDRQTDRKRDVNRQTNRQITDRQTGRQIDRHINRQTNRQTAAPEIKEGFVHIMSHVIQRLCA